MEVITDKAPDTIYVTGQLSTWVSAFFIWLSQYESNASTLGVFLGVVFMILGFSWGQKRAKRKELRDIELHEATMRAFNESKKNDN